ncbi:Uncharacterized protein dnm_047120 [Desulfonema magnum]|uniref:Uncharacterized protein n=1 Tax=Desulfonema magnum TaxID=45655 RepID=A0A975GPC8_9BACT|nr:Uncharacterized protein dnm_047120 [Desulfonema magnum]
MNTGCTDIFHIPSNSRVTFKPVDIFLEILKYYLRNISFVRTRDGLILI